MAKVIYAYGSKKTYVGLPEHLDNYLYFCTDSQEIFKGDALYTDGVRTVASYESLPAFDVAADGKLYICKDTGFGYVLNETRDGWAPVIRGFDGATLIIDDETGAVKIGSVPMESIEGLEEKFKEIEESGGGINADTLSDEFVIGEDGTLSIVAIPISKVAGLEERLSLIEETLVGGVHYRGSVETFEELPTDAKQGDLYEVKADNSEWCFNGEIWFDYGSTNGLTALARATLNAEQFEIDESGQLNIVGVDASLVKLGEQTLDEAFEDVVKDADLATALEDVVTDEEFEEKIADSAPQSDLSINDETNPAYVKGRTHWKEVAVDLSIVDSDVVVANLQHNSVFDSDYVPVVLDNDLAYGNLFTVVFDGVEYTLPVDIYYENSVEYLYLGSMGLFRPMSALPARDIYPFCLAGGGDVPMGVYVKDTTVDHHIKVFQGHDEYHTIDPKYLPELPADKVLPEVTEEDDGKVLTVVDGAWAAVDAAITDDEAIDALVETDMLMAVTSEGFILTDESGDIILW